MSSIRARTLRPSSSFLTRSFGVSGSRWPRAHWPWPLRVAVVGAMRGVLRVMGRAGYAEEHPIGGVNRRDRAPSGKGRLGQAVIQTALDTWPWSTWSRATRCAPVENMSKKVPAGRAGVHPVPASGTTGSPEDSVAAVGALLSDGGAGVRVGCVSTFTGFSDRALDFYAALGATNTREFWAEHKAVFEDEVRGPMQALV